MILFKDSPDLKNTKEVEKEKQSMVTTAMILASIKRLPNVIQIGLTHLQFKLIIWVTHPALKENHVKLVKVIVTQTLIANHT